MADVQKYSLIEELKKADETLQGSPSLLGMSMLSYPNYINAMRSVMFTSHLKQFLNLEEPDFPFLFTNTENIVGKYSHGYKEAKHNYTVERKIEKFKNLIEGDAKIYKLFIFDEDNQEYDVIERREVENLTENFGYSYDTKVIDKLKPGDKIKKGTVLYKSKSYDDDMNYAYGKNIVVMYTLDPYTSEDAAVASKSLSDMLTSIETETVSFGINNNEYLINLYGDDDHYQPLPYIGDRVSDIFAAIRQQFNNQLLHDFKDETLRRMIDTDRPLYCDKDEEILDYTIYCNADEWQNNPFYEQLNDFMISQDDYYQAILETCEAIVNSGYKYTQNVDYLYKRAIEFRDTKKKWRENNNVFGNLQLDVTMRRTSNLNTACKITGRYGNKSVISKIRPDDEMPFTEDGRRVDLLINLLAVINRTTSAALMEVFINSCNWKVRRQMAKLKTREEKANLLFDYIQTWSEKEYRHFFKKYSKKSDKGKDEFLDDAIKNGIYINIVPLWEETKPVFYKCIDVLHKFDFLKPDKLYVNKWGRKVPILNSTWVGEMYILKLKQSDRRGFSARSTGAVNLKGLPTRSFKSRSHLEQHSTSCIRFGEYESFNFSIGIPTDEICLFHALYRTSLKGRKALASLMFTEENDDEQMEMVLDKSYTSRVVEIFNVYMKCLGIKMEFTNVDTYARAFDDDEASHHLIDGKHYMCTNYQAYLLERICDIRDDILEDNPIILTSDLKDKVKEELKKRNYVTGSLDDELDVLKMMNKLLMSKAAIAKYEKANVEEELVIEDEFIDDEEYEELEDDSSMMDEKI